MSMIPRPEQSAKSKIVKNKLKIHDLLNGETMDSEIRLNIQKYSGRRPEMNI